MADVRNQVTAVDAPDPMEAAVVLLRQVQPFPDFVAELGKVHFNHAMTKLNTLGLLSAEPRSVVNGEVVDVARLLEQGSPLRPLLPEGPAVAGTLANRFVLPPGERTSPAALAAAPPAVTASHLVSEDARDLLAAGGWDAFLRLRAAECTQVITDHVNRMAEWGARDGRALSDILRSAA